MGGEGEGVAVGGGGEKALKRSEIKEERGWGCLEGGQQETISPNRGVGSFQTAEWLVGWLVGWMDGQMDGWDGMDELTNKLC